MKTLAALTLSLLLLACHGKDSDHHEDGEEGDDVSFSDGAPWEMSSLPYGYWVTDPENDNEGYAMLLLTDAELDCDALTGVDTEADLMTALSAADGLIFTLELESAGTIVEVGDTAGPEATARAADSAWLGLWMSGYSFSFDGEDERYMNLLAFHDGMAYPLGYYGGASWLRIDDMSSGAPAGEFNAIWWMGVMDATDCGEWVYEGGGETGWADSGW